MKRLEISIHAPARGATPFCFPSQRVYYFNPRSREGSDAFVLHPFRLPSIFQSTLPRGERQQIRTIFNYIFNIILANLSIFLKLNFIHDVFQYQSTVFILFYKCESPCILVCASHSHKQVIESMFHPLLFPAQRQCSLFLSYTDFQDSKI